MPLLIKGMQGLGDSVYQRPAVLHACLYGKRVGLQVYLESSWPQVYHDYAKSHGLRFVWPDETGLRTQRKNVCSLPPETFFRVDPASARVVSLNYDNARIAKYRSLSAIFEMQMIRALGTEDHPRFDFSLPVPAEWEAELAALELPQRYAVVRPITIRREWSAARRNCEPAALQRVVDNLTELGVHTVGVADIDTRFEWEVSPRVLGITHKFYQGQLTVTAILALMKHAVCNVGPVGFIAPAGLALHAPTLVVLGGSGGDNGPDVLADARADKSRFAVLSPEPLCPCWRSDPAEHRCNKGIPLERIDSEFTRWIKPFLT